MNKILICAVVLLLATSVSVAGDDDDKKGEKPNAPTASKPPSMVVFDEATALRPNGIDPATAERLKKLWQIATGPEAARQSHVHRTEDVKAVQDLRRYLEAKYGADNKQGIDYFMLPYESVTVTWKPLGPNFVSFDEVARLYETPNTRRSLPIDPVAIRKLWKAASEQPPPKAPSLVIFDEATEFKPGGIDPATAARLKKLWQAANGSAATRAAQVHTAEDVKAVKELRRYLVGKYGAENKAAIDYYLMPLESVSMTYQPLPGNFVSFDEVAHLQADSGNRRSLPLDPAQLRKLWFAAANQPPTKSPTLVVFDEATALAPGHLDAATADRLKHIWQVANGSEEGRKKYIRLAEDVKAVRDLRRYLESKYGPENKQAVDYYMVPYESVTASWMPLPTGFVTFDEATRLEETPGNRRSLPVDPAALRRIWYAAAQGTSPSAGHTGTARDCRMGDVKMPPTRPDTKE